MTAVSTAASAASFDTPSEDGAGVFPTLPGAMQRSQVSDLLREVRRFLGLSSAALETLLKVMDLTRPRDWTDPSAEPVCYATQIRIAQDLAKTPRQIRTHERVLFKLGLIEDRRRANGSRSKHGQCGLVLSALIQRIPELMAARDLMRAERERVEYLVARRSALYRKAKERIMELQPLHPADPALADIVSDFLDWHPTKELRALGTEALEQHIEVVRNAVEELDRFYEKSPKTSGRAEENFRPYIQDTTEETSEGCSATAHMRPAGKPADSDLVQSRPIGHDGKELKCESVSDAYNPHSLGNLTPLRLRAIASDDMRLYLDHETGGHRQPRMVDFTLAAIRRLPELGINPSAWEAAVDQMGDDAATLCILIIDANRNHPVTPVRRPGGALRAMTRAHARGGLNLIGSLIGLQERLRAGAD